MNAGGLRNRGPWGPVAAIIGIAVLVRLPSLGQPLIEHHTWRQTQTAYTAVVFAGQGIDILHPRLPVLGPPFEAPFEFPAFQAVAALLIDAGLPADTAGRWLALCCFAISALAVWLLARRLWDPRVAFIGLVAYCASPLSMMFGRQFLIEYLVVVAALVFALSALVWVETLRFRWLMAAILAGTLAATIKLPTWAPWPLLVLGQLADRHMSVKRWAPGLVLLTVIPLVAAGTWTAYADSIKAASPFTEQLTTASQVSWNFGSLAQRLEPANWAGIGFYFLALTVGLGWAPLLFAVPAAARRFAGRWTVLAILAIGMFPVLVLFNLYVVHDYYQVAIAPAWALLLGLGGAHVIDHLRRGARAVLLAVVGMSLAATWPYWSVIYVGAGADVAHFLDQAAEIERNSTPDELVMVVGDDWMPTALYYARRFGLAMPAVVDRDEVAPTAPLYSAVSIRDPAMTDLGALDLWPSVAPVGAQTYRVGASEAQLPAGSVHWTDRGGPAGRHQGPAVDVACDDAARPRLGAGILVNPGPRGIVLALDAGDTASARVWVDDLAPVPGRGELFLPTGPGVHIACTGASVLRLHEIARPDAP
jgi:dolichyl-phosphate-mannose-protein mannosyltransferase